MAKKKKRGFAELAQSLAPKNKQEAQAIVTRSERQGPSQAQIRAEQARKKAAENLRSEIKRSNNLSQVRSAALRASEEAASNMKAARAKGLQASSNVSDGTKAIKAMQDTYAGMSTNRKRALAGQGAGRPLIIGNSAYAGWQTSENDRIRRRTQSDKEYAKKVDAGLNLTGLTPTKLTAGLPTDEEKKYRKDYGYDKQAKQIIENRYKNTPGAAGFIDAWRTESAEKSMEEQYGKNNLDMDLIDKARGSGRYMVGNVAGQLSQFAMTAPVATAMEGAALTRAGINAARAGKAFRGAKTTRDALKIAGIRSGVQSLAAIPVNLLDALKENNAKDVLKRFGLNQGLDLVFGGLSEIPMLRRNIHYANAFNLNNAANRATTNSEKKALKNAAQRELKKVDKKTLEAAQAELRQADNAIDELRRSGFGRYGRTTGQQVDDVTAAARDGLANRQGSMNLDGLSDGATSRTARETAERATIRNAAEQASERPARNVAEEAAEQNAARTARNAASEAEQRQAANDTIETANQAWDDIPNAGDEMRPRSTEPANERLDNMRGRIADQFPEGEQEYGRTVTRVEDQYPEEMARGRELQEQMDAGAARGGMYKYGVPRQTAEGVDITRGLDRAVGRMGMTPEAEVETLWHAFVDGTAGGKAGVGIKEAQEAAAELWRLNSHAEMNRLDDAVSTLSKRNQVPKGYPSLQAFFAHAEQGLHFAQRTGNVDLETRIVEKSMEVASNMGTGMRQYQELLKATPAARMRLIEKQIADIEKRYAKQLKGKSIVLSDESKRLIRETDFTDPAEMANAMKQVSEEVWNQVPASLKEKVDAWRMTSMLLNPRTHARNIIGNAIFRPVTLLKDIVAVPMERTAIKLGAMNPEDATKAVLNRASAEDRALIDAGAEVFDRYSSVIRGEAKYFDNFRGGLGNRPMEGNIWTAGRKWTDEAGKVHYGNNPIISGMRRAADKIGGTNTKLLELEDIKFMKSKFSDSYAKVLKARGWDPANLTTAQMNDAMEAAGEEALRSTYRDASKLATFINKGRRVDPNASAARKTLAWAIDTTMPFVKTPVNILRRSGDYSPVGLINGISKVYKAAAEGNSKAMAEGIDRLAAGLTGSGAYALGLWLGAKDGGLSLNAKLADGNDGYYESDLGLQNYALNIGGDDGVSITLDWAVPVAIPLFAGVETANAMKAGEFDIVHATDVLGQALDPAFELSVLQGVSNLLASVQSGEGAGKAINEALVNTGLNYTSQFIPTVSGQLARTIDPVRRNTSLTTTDSTTGKAYQKWRNKQIAKIPGASKTLEPYVNVWGEEQRNGDSVVERTFNNFLNPAYVRNKQIDNVDREIMRLNAVDPSNKVTPSKLRGSKVGFDGEDFQLDAKDVTLYNKTKGQQSKAELRKLISSGEYQNASDSEKRKMVKRIYDDAGISAKQQALIQHGEDEYKVYTDDLSGKKKPDYQAAKDAGIDAETYYDLMTTKDWDYDGNGYGTKAEYVRYLNGRDNLTGAQKAIIFGKLSTAKNPYGEGVSKASAGSSRGGGRGRRGRSGRRSGGGSKAKRTESGKKFTATHTASDLRSNITPVRISSASAGLSKSQKKALLKLMKKRFEV